MIIVMQAGASREDLDRVVGRVEELRLKPHVIVGTERTVVAVVGDELERLLERLHGGGEVAQAHLAQHHSGRHRHHHRRRSGGDGIGHGPTIKEAGLSDNTAAPAGLRGVRCRRSHWWGGRRSRGAHIGEARQAVAREISEMAVGKAREIGAEIRGVAAVDDRLPEDDLNVLRLRDKHRRARVRGASRRRLRESGG